MTKLHVEISFDEDVPDHVNLGRLVRRYQEDAEYFLPFGSDDPESNIDVNVSVVEPEPELPTAVGAVVSDTGGVALLFARDPHGRYGIWSKASRPDAFIRTALAGDCKVLYDPDKGAGA